MEEKGYADGSERYFRAYKLELEEVREQLDDVETQIEILLQKQSDLQDRKQELEDLLTSQDKGSHDDKDWNKTDFTWSRELEEQLKSVFKMDSLRPMQLQTMNVTMSGKDCILIMPTGGGKSLCFQLPALLSKGVTLVVSPLVSLMEDQVLALRNYNVDVAMLNASTDKNELKAVQDAMTDKNASLKLLYVTPEKLAKSKRFMAKLEKMYSMGRLSRLVIDEVHCCSQWGHDFRPDYKFLGIMKRQFPEVPILGLTATATKKVIDDVKKILNIPSCVLFKASFNRPNLYYEVRAKPSNQNEAMNEIQALIQTRFKDQSGIIYCFTRKESEEVTINLQQRGIKAGCYHADLSPQERSRVHKMWLSNQIKVVVATVAFGMGIDKPDVRFVIHHSLSKSMENLYQESGRAGRDDKTSHCIVYYRLADIFRQSTMVFTEQTGLENLYGIMTYCTDVARCRRSIIARHFGETWDSSHCNKMCDHCKSSEESEKRDITKFCQIILEILHQASCSDEKLTALKLMDAWQGKKVGTLKVTGLNPPVLSKEKLERVLSRMLILGYIREDFHFTPYSTIGYLVPGQKSKFLKDGLTKVYMEVSKKKDENNKPLKEDGKPKHENVKNKTVHEKVKPKLVIVKSQSPLDPSTASQNDKDNKKDKTLVKKRKKVVISDSDSDLDFGDQGSSKTVAKKKYFTSKTHEKTSFHENNSDSDFVAVKLTNGAILIDSDSN